MDHECEACGRDYGVRDGMEPTPLCDPCAHKAVAELREAVELIAWLGSEGCDLRSETYADDDFGYTVVEHHMAQPRERIIGRGRTPVEAMRDARAAQLAAA